MPWLMSLGLVHDLVVFRAFDMVAGLPSEDRTVVVGPTMRWATLNRYLSSSLFA